MPARVRVLVWNEHIHEKKDDRVRSVYPAGIHAAVADALGDAFERRTATLDDPEQGLDRVGLDRTDVLVLWAHLGHDLVSDATADRVVARVHDGMGLVVLHSAAHSKVFRRLMGTSCALRWREDERHCRLWVLEPSHPIAAGLPEHFVIPVEEMYGERFDVPRPDDTVFLSWFPGGEVFRSGLTWTRGLGRIFYFQPGHETYPIYRQPEVALVLRNAVTWAAYRGATEVMRDTVHAREPLEPWGRGP